MLLKLLKRDIRRQLSRLKRPNRKKVKRESRVDERHDEIMKVYEEVIKEYGSKAPYIKKYIIYGTVSDRTHYSLEHVRTVIAKRLKRKSSHT